MHMAMELNFLTTMLWPCPLLTLAVACVWSLVPWQGFSERSPSFSLPCMFSAHPVLPVREREMSLFFELLPFHYQLKCYTLWLMPTHPSTFYFMPGDILILLMYIFTSRIIFGLLIFVYFSSLLNFINCFIKFHDTLYKSGYHRPWTNSCYLEINFSLF